jgi:hypothetical protein
MTILEAELAALAADAQSKVPVYASSYYALASPRFNRTALERVSAGLKVSTSTDPAGNADFHWMFVPTDVADQYYLQHVVSGMYVSVASDGARVKAEASSANSAIAFNLVEVSEGKFALQNSENPNVYLACDGSKNVVGSKDMSSTNSQWTITLVADNHSASFKAQLEALLGLVSNTIKELLVAAEPDLQFHTDVTVLDEQLPLYVTRLLEANDAAVKGLNDGYMFLDELYAALKAAHDQTKAAYRKALTLPEATNDAEVMCYYIQCLSNDGYAYCTEDGRYLGALRTGELTDAADHNYWFYLRPGENAGEYYIYNLETGLAVGHKGYYIYANGTAEAESYTLTISEDSYGFVIGSAEGNWNVQTSSSAYLQFRSSSTVVLWNLIPIGKYNPAGIEAVVPDAPAGSIYYDLLGRPVAHPSAGIYIHNGRKVIVK